MGHTKFKVKKHGLYWTVRYWKNDNGVKRLIRERVCPVAGPGFLFNEERRRKAKEIIDAASGKIALPDVLPEEGKDKINFKEAAERWLKKSQYRRKHPLKKNTLRLYRNYLERWIYPVLADVPLAQVKTSKAKEVIDRMHERESSASVMADTFHIITQVVASIRNAHFEPMFNVKWNLEEIDIPDVRKKQQKAFNS